MRYLSIDTETTGIETGRHQVLEIGAIVENTEVQADFVDIPKINIILAYEEYLGSSYALGLNSEIFHILADYEKAKNKGANYILELEKEVGSKIRPYNMAHIDLQKFLLNHYLTFYEQHQHDSSKPVEVTAAGKNVAGFDIPKLNLLPNFKNVVKFSSRTIDPANYCVWPTDHAMPNTKTCLERAKIERDTQHRAISDAWDVIEILRSKAKGFLYVAKSLQDLKR